MVLSPEPLRSEFRVYAGLNSPAFHVSAVLSRCAVLTRLKAELRTAASPNVRLPCVEGGGG